jgi:hypothetical protein
LSSLADFLEHPQKQQIAPDAQVAASAYLVMTYYFGGRSFFQIKCDNLLFHTYSWVPFLQMDLILSLQLFMKIVEHLKII